jgi:general secretion pathway protein D
LDKSKAEVVVDVAVMQINRDKARTLGISPPTSASVTLQPNVNTTTTSTGTTTNTTGTTSTTGSSGLSLNALGNLNATDFQVTISQATATALFTDSHTKLVQNPQIRAVDGQKATLKIGSRVPVASGSFSSGIGSTGIGVSPLVNTQFQYLDVGVNIDITPKIHSNGEVTLKITMDISSVTSFTNIGGINQPVIGQRKIEHEVRLREGEVNLLGGMMEDSQSRTLTGIPGLSQIPILKWLFGQTATDHSETETVFALIPRLVRRQDLSDLNERAIAVGTASAIELRRITPAVVAPVPPPSAAAPSNSSPANPAPAPAQPSSQGGPASFNFDPGTITQKAGTTFSVNVMLTGAQNAYSVPLQVSYDPKTLQVVNVSNGNFLSQDGQVVALVHRDDDSSGTLQITATRPPGASGVSGQGTVVTLTFLAKSSGQSTLAISKGGARDPSMQPIPVAGAAAAVTIQ